MPVRAALENGHPVSAREAFLRASNYYRSAELLSSPGDPLHHEMWQKSRACFRQAGALFDPPIEPISVPFDGRSLPGYFIPAASGGQKRPTVIVLGGGVAVGGGATRLAHALERRPAGAGRPAVPRP